MDLDNDSRFSIYAQFDVIIPKNFTLDGMDHSREQFSGGVDPNITDKNFPPTWQRSETVMKKAVIVELSLGRYSNRMVEMIKDHKGIFPNALGLAVVRCDHKDKLPKNKWIVGIDDPWVNSGCLWIGPDNHRMVPCLGGDMNGWRFVLVEWNDSWYKGTYVLFFI